MAADDFSAEWCRERHLTLEKKCDERHMRLAQEAIELHKCLNDIKIKRLRELEDRIAIMKNYYIAILVALVANLALQIILQGPN